MILTHDIERVVVSCVFLTQNKPQICEHYSEPCFRQKKIFEMYEKDISVYFFTHILSNYRKTLYRI